ncbi:MAG: hypothetical protein VKK05_03170 [Synechococcus sp.]|jgi:hypothetical protein|nr:hypothetical protein [Synechococcus sp.]
MQVTGLVDAKEICSRPLLSTSPDWTPFLPGVALWALALYLPLSGPLARLEEALAAGPMPEGVQQIMLVVSSLLLALAIGVLADLALSWALGPDWASSMGLIAAGWGLFTALANRAKEDGE